MGFDMLLQDYGGQLVLGVTTIVASIGWYLRRERVESAKTKEVVAELTASESKHVGQTDEILRLGQQLTELSHETAKLRSDVSELKARMIGLKVLFHSFILCESCKHKNHEIITALESRFNQHYHSES